MKTDRHVFFLFIFVFAAYSFYFSSGSSGNVQKNMALTRAIVEHGSLSIDAYKDDVADKAYYKNHYYIAGEPGISFLAVPAHFAVNKCKTFLKLSEHFIEYYSRYAVRVCVISFPSACIVFTLYFFLNEMNFSRRTSFVLTFIYSMASPAYVYSTLLYRHQLTAAACFYIFCLIYRLKENPSCRIRIYLIGLLMGFTFWCDYTSFPLLLLLLAYFFIYARKVKEFQWFLFGALPYAVCTLSYNYVCFDNVLSGGFLYSLTTSEENYGISIGALLSRTWGFNANALFQITLSAYRGIFFYFPLSFLAFLGIFDLKSWRGFRIELFLCFLLATVYIIFIASMGDWAGALGSITRRLVPVLPFTIPLIGVAWNKHRLVSIGLMFYSFLIALIVNISPAGEAPGETGKPLSFFLQAELHGFFRSNVLDFYFLNSATSILVYLGMLMAAILLLQKLKNAQ